MKIKILAVLILFSCIMFSGCDIFHTAAEKSAIDRCKNACKVPTSFKLIEVNSWPDYHSAEWKYDTTYFYKGEKRLTSSSREWGLVGYCILDGNLKYYPKYVKYDSISITKTGHDAYTDITISVKFTAKNLFGVELSNIEFFSADNNASYARGLGSSSHDVKLHVKSESFKKPQKVLNTHTSGHYRF